MIFGGQGINAGDMGCSGQMKRDINKGNHQFLQLELTGYEILRIPINGIWDTQIPPPLPNGASQTSATNHLHPFLFLARGFFRTPAATELS